MAELGEWLSSGDPARVAAARRHLQEVADTDIPRVAVTARAFLDTRTTPQPPGLVVPAPTPPVPVPLLRPARTLTGHAGWVRGVAFSPDGRLLATASTDKTAWLWDPATGGWLRTLAGHAAGVRGVAFSPDGRLLATASTDKTAWLWDPVTGDCLRTLTGHAESIYGVAFSPDGRLLATASIDRTARVWN